MTIARRPPDDPLSTQFKRWIGRVSRLIPGCLYFSSTATPITGTGDTDLFSATIPTNALAVNGDCIKFHAAGTMANSGFNKRIKVYLEAEGIQNLIYDTTSLAFASGADKSWNIKGEIYRVGTQDEAHSVVFTSDDALLKSDALYSESVFSIPLNSKMTLRVTGQGTAAADIIGKVFRVDHLPGPILG